MNNSIEVMNSIKASKIFALKALNYVYIAELSNKRDRSIIGSLILRAFKNASFNKELLTVKQWSLIQNTNFLTKYSKKIESLLN